MKKQILNTSLGLLTVAAVGWIALPSAIAIQASYVHVLKNETPDTRFHLGELEAFANGAVPDELGGATFDGMTTSTNDIGDGTLTTFGDGNDAPVIGTTTALEHGGANKDPNNVLENVGNVWSTGNNLASNAQYTLDLGGSFDVTTVRMWPRADGCCANRWQNLEIQLLDENQTPIPGTQQLHTANVGNVSLELTYLPGSTEIDSIASNPALTYPTEEDDAVLSSAANGTLVTTLSALNEFGGQVPDATYTLVPGAGDGNNGMYSIGGPGGNELLVNADLSGEGGNPHSVRVLAESEDDTLEAIVSFTVLEDSDADALIDDWEMTFGVLGDFSTGGDSDADGSNDEEEFAIGTDPSDPDGDDDGSNDGDELANGTDPFDPDSDDDGLNDGDEATATSDPLNPDTDGDGLTDGDEVSNANGFVTSPILADTDSDGFNDSLEIDFGTDPTDDTDFPQSSGDLTLLACWDFNDAGDAVNTTDLVAGNIGVLSGGAVRSADGGGRTGLAGDYSMDFGDTSANQFVDVQDASFLNIAASADLLTISFWQKNDNPAASTSSFWGFSPSSNGSGRGIQAHVPWGNGTIFFDSAGCCAVPTQRLSGVPAGGADLTQWTHYAFVKNGETKEVWVDGVMELTNSGASPLPTDFTVLAIGSATNGGNSLQGEIDDFAVFFNALTEVQVLDLAAGNSPHVPKQPFQVTEIEHDLTTDELVLTWNSKTGKTYALETSLILEGWIEVDDGIKSQGESTTIRIPVAKGEARRHYRILEL